MKNRCVLLSGPAVADDEDLDIGLQNYAVVFKNPDNNRLETISSEKKIDLILLELLDEHPAETEVIKKIKARHPHLEIIVIAGASDSEMLAKAFECGAKDAFRKPYKTALIVERIAALLYHQEHVGMQLTDEDEALE